MPNEFPSAKLSTKSQPQLAKSGHVAVIVLQARLLKAFFAPALYFDTQIPPRYHPAESSSGISFLPKYPANAEC
ncbi:hypothetical protein PILCRDRAFT_2593 [Piloderma croceum F 1598]|uniref:Uncharacterized protein n=1 Tax=Piloderma croceum (strain F 1598) TaxID=765440 RepID=A0A0C3CHV4_PILCF|nr:hypothetical protein PILCRDRAFT_2593 [Piloderma croceum F 1598]